MDGVGNWRLIESEDEPSDREAQPAPVAEGSPMPRLLVAAVAGLVLGAAALAIWATLPTGGATVDAGDDTPFSGRAATGHALSFGDPASTDVPSAGALTSPEPELVVDIEGAVVAPGLHALPPGSRLGDAIRVAGGYTSSVDIPAASRTLNLAERLTDGQQIRVPVLGDDPVATTAAAPGINTDPAGGGGLIDLNHATADQLDTLPGIGPVTAAKIIDARTQAPFATVDELQSRGVVGASTFEKIRDLVTITP